VEEVEMPKRIRLIAWREDEGKARASELAEMGHPVVYELLDVGSLLRVLKEDPPGALVIDLTRSPGNGRDLAVALRIHKVTRHVPLIFAGGTAEKVEEVRSLLPDARFAPWSEISRPLDRALTDPVTDPVVPDSALAGYSGMPLPKKLGIKDATQVLLAGAPGDFMNPLGPVPKSVTLVRRFGPRVDLILWFVQSRKELIGGIEKWAPRVGAGGMWIIWPKKGSELHSDLRQDVVRRTGLDAGLVDYKIAAVDRTWSGLKFAVRRSPAE
jgi:hypothetical protein